MANATKDEHALDELIDKLQDTLDHARGLPGWAATLVVIVTLVCIIVLLHVLALMVVGPCLYGVYLRRKRVERECLLDEEEIMDPDNIELSPASETPLHKDHS